MIDKDLLSSIFQPSAAVSTAAQAVFTQEVLTTIATANLEQYNRIEAAIARLVPMAGSSNAEAAGELATAISVLRQTSLTYLPKV